MSAPNVHGPLGARSLPLNPLVCRLSGLCRMVRQVSCLSFGYPLVMPVLLVGKVERATYKVLDTMRAHIPKETGGHRPSLVWLLPRVQ